MTKTSRLWVVVADGEQARIVVPGESPGSYRTDRSVESVTAHQKSSDLGTDAPGRSYESANPARHAIAPRSDPHDLAKQRFVAEIARLVNEAANAATFDRLVLAAPAHTLHDLRAALSAAAADRLVGVLQKDLVKTPDAEIGPHLTWDVLHGGGEHAPVRD